MNKNTNRRWAALRKSTGKAIRSFRTREDARNFKRTASTQVKLFDNVNGMVVR